MNFKYASLIIVVASTAFSLNSNAVTHDCECEISSIYSGFTGAGNSTKGKVDCIGGNSYALGQLSDDLGKARYSTALASFMAGKKIVFQYWSSDGGDNCEAASLDLSRFPDGIFVK